MGGVLVAFASKMGGTKEISTRLAEALRERGMKVDLLPAVRVESIADYDAMALGSAIYNGRWRPEMVRFLQRLVVSGNRQPIWLFHSGPLGDEHAGEEQPLPRKVGEMTEALDVRGVTTFGGRLPEHPEGLIARLMARSQSGDWRDFAEVDELAGVIASALTASGTSV